MSTSTSFATARDIILDAGGATFAVSSDTTLTLSGMIDDTGDLTKAGGGTLKLDGRMNRYSGDTNVMVGTLQAGAADTFSPNSTVTVASTGTLDLAGFNQRVAGLSNAGLVNLGTGTHPGAILNVNGNYAGNNSGVIALNTSLGSDNAPTDQMVVSGDTSGASLVRITNANGPGDHTMDGIKIIDISGASNGIFTLQGDYNTQDNKQAIVAGAYAYTLEKNGISTPTDGDWYLRSGRYQPGVSSYEAYPQALLALNRLPTLQQRVGNRLWSASGAEAQPGQGSSPGEQTQALANNSGAIIEGSGVWGRVEGGYNKTKPRSTTSDTSYDQDAFRMQIGVDRLLKASDNGKLIGGLAIHYVHGNTNTQSPHGNGEINTDGYGVGGTLTWYNNNGFYLDGQLQATKYDSDLSSKLTRKRLTESNDGFGYATSIEGGKRIALDPNWSITPQAQLAYSKVDFDTFTDPFGARVSNDQGESLQARLGVTIDHESSRFNGHGAPVRSHVYGSANLHYEFLGETKVNVANTSFASRNDRLSASVGVGGSYNWDGDKYSIYGEGLVNTSLRHFGDSYSVVGRVGFRMRW